MLRREVQGERAEAQVICCEGQGQVAVNADFVFGIFEEVLDRESHVSGGKNVDISLLGTQGP